jgi:hypothetical protein
MVALAGCTTAAPPLPADESATFDMLTGVGGQNSLSRMTGFHWEDGGAAAATSLAWIGRDANSSDLGTATRAGQAAFAIATHLERIDQGQIGERNPELTLGYATALAPFQGAMIGNPEGTSGFASLVDGINYAPVRNIFQVITTDAKAGDTFAVAAYEKADAYARRYGEGALAAGGQASNLLPLAAVLAGVTHGGAQKAGGKITTRNAQQAVVYASYNVAAALRPQPGDLDAQFFTAESRLKSPDQVSGDDATARYATELQTYLGQRKPISLAMDRFESQFNLAAGNY